MTTDSQLKNTEIWSTRLQRELLALTSDNGPEATKESVQGALPAFVSIREHKLAIERGDCSISFDVVLPSSSNAVVVVTLDASLRKNPDGSVNAAAVAYPFLKPTAILTSGAAHLPEGSTIQDGDQIDIELDWTPSLHLTDAILNISLKMKECVSQGEPFHGLEVKQDAVDEMVNKAKKFGSSITNSLKGFAGGKSSPAKDDADKKEKKKGFRLGRKKKAAAETSSSPPGKVTPAKGTEVRIGDEINMLEAPWVDCQGVYSCKAIRRPGFVEDAMTVAAQTRGEIDQVRNNSVFSEDNGEVPESIGDYMKVQAGALGQVANASLTGAGAMLKSFTQSAKSVLEESFLMITDTHIIEMRSNKLNLSTGTITFAIPIELLAKLKFRRQESLSLFFKPAPDDPLIFMCPDSAEAVHQIQAVLRRHGVKGKHTNAATHRAINQALHLVQEIQTKEIALKHDPTVERVNEIMDLYRQAAERFETAGDVRHEEVVTHMRKFLAMPLTVSILEGSHKGAGQEGEAKPPAPSGEGVVLKPPPTETAAAKSDGAATESNSEEKKKDDKEFEQSMNDILREAEADLANIQIEDDPELDAAVETPTGARGDPSIDNLGDDAILEFENMLKEADEELAELIGS